MPINMNKYESAALHNFFVLKSSSSPVFCTNHQSKFLLAVKFRCTTWQHIWFWIWREAPAATKCITYSGLLTRLRVAFLGQDIMSCQTQHVSTPWKHSAPCFSRFPPADVSKVPTTRLQLFCPLAQPDATGFVTQIPPSCYVIGRARSVFSQSASSLAPPPATQMCLHRYREYPS